MIPQWQPGTLYPPGTTVRPVAAPAAVSTPIANPGFESGDVDWTKGTGWTIQSGAGAQSGTWRAVFSLVGTSRLVSTTAADFLPGQSITVECSIRQGASTTAQVEVDFLDASNNIIQTVSGNVIGGTNSTYRTSSVTAVAPANTARVRPAVRATGTTTNQVWVDNFYWNHIFVPQAVSLAFTAVQADAGYSGAVEPVWPAVDGDQVTDNEVTWEAVNSSRVVWEANPILVSDLYEPAWPGEVDATVIDGTIRWTAVSRRVEDANCPNGPIVVSLASKIFCADGDIISYSATVNPLDWTTAEDAGYLPFGLQSFAGNQVTAMGAYRSNLVAFSNVGFQMWQVDEDPANMALLDSAPIPCTWPLTLQAVMNDLLFLSPVGVRSIGIAGASTNLQAGTLGEPVDPLVVAELRDGTYEPISATYPAMGQYWLIFGPQAFVMTVNGKDNVSWSRYVFPEAITDATLLGEYLYLRTATGKVWRVDEEFTTDDNADDNPGGTAYTGRLRWHHLDFGSIGVEKQFIGFDLVADTDGQVSVSIGYDQRDVNARTAEYTVDGDTLPAKLVPIPVTGPSFDMQVTFTGGEAWEWFASVIYLQDRRPGS